MGGSGNVKQIREAILEADRDALMEARGIGERVALKIITQRDEKASFGFDNSSSFVGAVIR